MVVSCKWEDTFHFYLSTRNIKLILPPNSLLFGRPVVVRARQNVAASSSLLFPYGDRFARPLENLSEKKCAKPVSKKSQAGAERRHEAKDAPTRRREEEEMFWCRSIQLFSPRVHIDRIDRPSNPLGKQIVSSSSDDDGTHFRSLLIQSEAEPRLG